MGDVNLWGVAEKLSSDKSRDRIDGLADLEQYLRSTRAGSRSDTPSDDGFHKVFEALFYFVRLEKASYVRATTSKAQNTSSSRLSSASSALRSLVDLANERITSKTVNAVIDHIVDSLPAPGHVPGHVFCEPLAGQYLRALGTILQYAPHTEHLRKAKWQEIVEFITGSLTQSLDGYEGKAEELPGTPQPDSRRADREPSFVSANRTQMRVGRIGLISQIEDLLSCLSSLVRFGNHPLISYADVVGNGMIDVIRKPSLGSAVHHPAFCVLNRLLSILLTENVSFFRNLVIEGVDAIRRLWTTKSTNLREEMIIMLRHVQDLLRYDNRDKHELAFEDTILALYDVMKSEYTKRQDRDVLHSDEVVFSKCHFLDLSNLSYGPHLQNSAVLMNWTTLSFMASVLLYVSDGHDQRARPSDSDEQPTKRRRIDSLLHQLVDQATSATQSGKVCALQLISFLLPESESMIRIFQESAKRILAATAGDNGDGPCWTLLACCSLASLGRAHDGEFRGFWASAWESGIRCASVAGSSRIACHLLDVMWRCGLAPQSRPHDIVNSLFSGGSGGPSVLSDSALSLLANLMTSCDGESLQGRVAKRDKILAWINTSWLLSSHIDKIHTSRLATHALPALLVNALTSCANGRQILRNRVDKPLASALVSNLHTKSQTQELVQFLLQSDDGNLEKPKLKLVPVVVDCHRPSGQTWDRLVSNLLLQKIDNFEETWTIAVSQRASNATRELIKVVTSACLTAFIVANSTQNPERNIQLLDRTEQLWKRVCAFLAGQDIQMSSAAREVIVLTLSSVEACSEHYRHDLHLALTAMMSGGANLLHRRLVPSGSSNVVLGDSPTMMIEDSLHSERSQGDEQIRSSTGRDDLPFAQSITLHISALWLQLRLEEELWLIADANSGYNDGHRLIDVFLEADLEDLVASKATVVHALRRCTIISRSKACELLEKLAATCLQRYESERSEGSLCFCLEIMEALAHLWALDDDDDLYSVAYDIYSWYLQVGLGKGIAPERVLIQLARLLGVVLNINAGFARRESEPSPRTHLIELLQNSNNVVRFYATPSILDLFGHFVLNQHDKIFNDVIEHLPTDPTYLEGIVLRLFVLTKLACKWHNLLRRCIYHLFETPALIPQCSDHARQCITTVCQMLHIDHPQQLFKLFAPQILYTWLQVQSVDSIPYRIFGYAKLKDLLLDVLDEVVAQTFMREDEQNIEKMSAALSLTRKDLLLKSFAKVEAYCIARDISMPRSQSDQNRSVESSLKKQLGASTFLQMVQNGFPSIIATLILSTNPEEGFDKALSRHENSQLGQSGSQVLRSLGEPPLTVASSQQPSFRAKYVLDEISFACKRAQLDSETIWTPALLVYVSRQLNDAATPALGPSHACGMLRRLRLILALSGPTALSGYCLQMLLHFITPFLADFHCSEDAISICRYLLEGSTLYLESVPVFFTGFVITSFALMMRFLDTQHDSTTQESLFETTMSNAKQFQEWLSAFSKDYKPKNVSSLEAESLHALLISASSMQLNGAATKDSHEGHVIVGLLHNLSQNARMISQRATDSILGVLSERVVMAEGLQDDLFEDDRSNVDIAPYLLQLLKRLKLSATFRLWTAKVVGRAYAASGKIDMSLLNRSVFPKSTLGSREVSSTIFILQCLSDLLFDGCVRQSGNAERTLQDIVSNMHDSARRDELEAALDSTIIDAMTWDPYVRPQLPSVPRSGQPGLTVNFWLSNQHVEVWASEVTSTLCLMVPNEPLLQSLPYILTQHHDLAVNLFPCILHLALAGLAENCYTPQQESISKAFQNILGQHTQAAKPLVRLVLNTMVYLRGQTMKGEATIADRDKWLDIDLMDAVKAAMFSQMWEAALLFLELHIGALTQTGRSRRSSVSRIDEQLRSVQSIFENLSDPDSFYGIPQEPSITSVMKRLNYENEGFKSLSFQSASFDALMRLNRPMVTGDAEDLLRSLNTASLQGIAYGLNLADSKAHKASNTITQRAALSLRQWDLQPSSGEDAACLSFEVLQQINQMDDILAVQPTLNGALIRGLNLLLESDNVPRLQESVVDIASLTELSDIFARTTTTEMEEIWQRISSRNDWMRTESIDSSQPILTTREAVFSSIHRRPYLSEGLNISSSQAFLYEVQSVRDSLKINQDHGELQPALNCSAYLSLLSSNSRDSGIDISAAAQLDLARVLWGQGEMIASIHSLRDLAAHSDLHNQAIPVSRLEILAEIGHHVAEARLEKPEEIQAKYLLPALKEVKNSPSGTITGRVYHEFAAFCDKQLLNPDDLDDFIRIEKLRTRKEKEVQDLEKMIKQAEGKQRDALKIHKTKAKQWFDLDDREYQRLKKIREGFLEKCLSSYLLTLRACDDFDTDVLRFVALWLDQSDNSIANSSVEANIKHVASRKFAPLMNQLSSRLLDDRENIFQKILFDLIVRICSEHPYHGMYQIFASSKSKGGRDEIALSRHAAANRVTEKLRETRAAGTTWIAVHNANISFVRFAVDRLDDSKSRSGSKFTLSRIPSGSRMEQEIVNSTTKIPPPTLKVRLRADCDYSSVPRLVRFDSHVSIAGGVSAPKIVTMVASDGTRHKALFKGGNDDLRQDSIMEQVFEEVSNLLRNHRSTRQRQLGIRTYKVLPLTANAGIIEFVQNTIPLHDYLLPAHQRYYPKDLKPSQCRKMIADAQNRSVETRVSIFKKVTDHFRPVMRYFFMERFMDPVVWFQKRLAYSRSTAAISILGHVLGLGDRHGHNILLDEQTGEVVHIDLGVAFEAGRVLPVPEVVPFRLTRDLVDGMGITGTEGVFRRCCNFTLEALRQESDSIMTILDVLRYDPLYSWSVSPLRLRKMQESQQIEVGNAAAQGGDLPGLTTTTSTTTGARKDINEPSEADRALTVVAKKLGKGLSVEATVNELIQVATDERNLAVLYCGWAAYA